MAINPVRLWLTVKQDQASNSIAIEEIKRGHVSQRLPKRWGRREEGFHRLASGGYGRKLATGGGAYRLPPECWCRGATNRSIHLERLTGREDISKSELHSIYPRCLFAYRRATKSSRFSSCESGQNTLDLHVPALTRLASEEVVGYGLSV
jgi:hypothetical protein